MEVHPLEGEDIARTRGAGLGVGFPHPLLGIVRQTLVPVAEVGLVRRGDPQDADAVPLRELGLFLRGTVVAGETRLDRLVDFQPVFPARGRGEQVFEIFLQRGVLLDCRVVVRLEPRLLRDRLLGFFFGRAEPLAADRVRPQAVAQRRQADPRQHGGGRRHGPRLLLSHQAGGGDLGREQRGLDPRQSQALQCQSVRDGERQHILLEQRRVQHTVARQPLERLDPLHFHIEVLLQEFLQPGQLEPVPHPEDLRDLRLPVDRGEEANRPLDFGDVVVEDWPQRLEHRLGVGSLRGVALEMLGLGEGQLHVFGQGPGEVVSAHGDVADPDLLSVRHQQHRVVGAHVEHQLVFTRLFVPHLGRHAQPVVTQEVVQRQRRDLDLVDFHLAGNERIQVLHHQVPLHGEQPHLGVEQKARLGSRAPQGLKVPDDFFEGERDLLPGLVLHNLDHPARFDGRELNELGQRRLPGHADDHAIALGLVAPQERVERLPDQFLRVRIGLAQDFGMGDVVEIRRHHLAG